MAGITKRRNLNPARRHGTYPRVVKRARHNQYRVKKPRVKGTRHPGRPAIRLVDLALRRDPLNMAPRSEAAGEGS